MSLVVFQGMCLEGSRTSPEPESRDTVAVFVATRRTTVLAEKEKRPEAGEK